MPTETRAKLDKANRDWDVANMDCQELLSAMISLGEQHAYYPKLLEDLLKAQQCRQEAGDRVYAAMKEGLENFTTEKTT